MIIVIALVTMLTDHIGRVYFPGNLYLAIIGRLSFPLFAWGIARGYSNTRNFKRYAARLLVLAFISQVPYMLLFNNGYINICFTLFSGLIVLKIYDGKLNAWFKWTSIILISVLTQDLHLEYGIYGIATILLYHMFWNNDLIFFYQGLLTLVCTLVFRYEPLQIFAVFSTMIILFLRNKDFKINKLLKYSFYPVHLLVLVILKNGGLL